MPVPVIVLLPAENTAVPVMLAPNLNTSSPDANAPLIPEVVLASMNS